MAFNFLAGVRWSIVLFLVGELHAQWYAPATEYHDPVQRVYPVELARVLAAQANQHGEAIAEVRFGVSSSPAQTSWFIDWIDAEGAVRKKFNVAYPGSLLLSGGEFYRQVLAQFREQGAVATGQSDNADKAAWVARFWSGFGQMRGSRMATLRVALGKKIPAEAGDDAELSALLLAASLPGITGQVTLDSTLSARGAAWLALAESSDRDNAAAKACWAPVLWLAHRESQAEALWAEGARNAPSDTRALKAWRYWQFILSKPAPRAVFAEAARQTESVWSLPLLAYGARLRADPELMAKCFSLIFRDQAAEDIQAHDQAACLFWDGGVAAGHMSSFWPALARKDWLQTLNAQPAAQRQALPGLAEAWERAWQAREQFSERTGDPALMGFAGAAELLRLACRAGSGTLAPTATATTRDLLNFGWENTGMQLGGRHQFLDKSYGVAEEAAEFQRTVLNAVPEFGLFSQRVGWNPQLPGIDDYNRLQRIEGCAAMQIFAPGAIFGVESEAPAGRCDGQRARAALKQNWLALDPAAWALWGILATRDDRQPGEFAQVLRRAQAEGGRMLDRRLLVMMNVSGNAEHLRRVPERRELERLLTREFGPGDGDWFTLRWPEIAKLPALAKAEELERICWEEPSDGVIRWTFDAYLEAGAEAAAKRFFDDALPFYENTIGLSNHMGPRRCILALLDEDYAKLDQVLEAMSTYSHTDLTTRIVCAVARGRMDEAQKIAQACRERYSTPQSVATIDEFLSFIPLWPALGDSQHPDHEKALDHFAETTNWMATQWFLAKNAKLSAEDAARFFGGETAGTLPRLFALSLRGEKETYALLFDEMMRQRRLTGYTSAFVIAQRLRNQLREPPPLGPSLKPATPRTIPMEVEAVMAARAPRPKIPPLLRRD